MLEVELFAWALTDAKTVDEIRLNLERAGTFSEKELADIPALGLTSLIGQYTFDSAQERVLPGEIAQWRRASRIDEFDDAIKRLSTDPYSFVLSVLNQPDRANGEFAAAVHLGVTKRVGKAAAQIWAGMFCRAGIQQLLREGEDWKVHPTAVFEDSPRTAYIPLRRKH